MALNIAGYVTPEQSFEGLHGAAGMLRQQAQVDEQRKTKAAAQRASMAQMLMGSLDQKDFLTGTAYDPQVVQNLGSLMEEGMQLANMEGMDASMLKMALAPKLNKLAQYTTAVKGVNERIREQLKMLPNDSGYDKLALEREARNAAFLGEGGELRDMSQVDPEADYITAAVQRNPLGVVDRRVIDDVIKGFEPEVTTGKVETVDARGRIDRRDSKIETRGLFTYDPKEKWVPKYAIAKDGEAPIIGEFLGEDGQTKVKAPIRLLDEAIYGNIIKSNPAMANLIRGEVGLLTGGKKIDVGQEHLLGRMVAYDLLKPKATGSILDAQKTKDAPVINIGSGGSRGSGSASRKDQPTIDEWTPFFPKLKALSQQGRAYTGDAIPNTLFDVIKERVKANKNIDITDNQMIRVMPGVDESEIKVYDKNSNQLLATIKKTEYVIAANKDLGIEAREEIIRKSNTPPPAAKNETLADRMRKNRK